MLLQLLRLFLLLHDDVGVEADAVDDDDKLASLTFVYLIYVLYSVSNYSYSCLYIFKQTIARSLTFRLVTYILIYCNRISSFYFNYTLFNRVFNSSYFFIFSFLFFNY